MPNELTRLDIDSLTELRERLAQARLVDRVRLARELDRLFAWRQRDADFNARVSELGHKIAASTARVQALNAQPLRIAYDSDLPITAHRDEILKVLTSPTQPVLILCGATGSGKTTQLPKLCIEAGRGSFGLIGHTQPRRIAARAIAARLASELQTTVGAAVGYQVRFNDRSGPETRVKLMTDGILLKELESDRLLLRYDTIIIDEAHERSLNIDLLLGVLRRILTQRSDLKLIVTSATIDPQKFSSFFGNAPIIEVSGRSYPVEVRYRPLSGEDEDAVELSLPEGVVSAVRELDGGGRGDVLVFLPGEKQIRDCNESLSRAKLGNTEILPLFSRLSTNEQERIFAGHSQRRVVLATNVAETSLTVPGIRNVIDTGLARISRYSVRGKVQRLPIEKIAKASADQRKGRCGREAEGICIRLYSEDDFNAREDFTAPEVLRTNLASVILRLAVLGLGEPGEFPFIDAPDTRQINDGYRLLQELKAVDDDRRVTALGKNIAALPVDPRLARMLIAASHHTSLTEMLVIASFLEIQDPRERPVDAQAQADQAHAIWADPRSDFIAVLNLWGGFTEKSAELSGSQLRKWCRERFLSFVRMREWQELHRQLSEAVDEIELKRNQMPAEYGELHQAILTGFLGNVGTVEEKRDYLGARGTRFTIAPGTPLASKPPKWIVAASIMETTRVFARMVAMVETSWIERAGEHLLKRSYAEPQWVEQKGLVGAYESTSLYGLTLISQRRVNYGSVMPQAAREIFAREGLVEGRSASRAEFLMHNRRLRDQVEAMEAKTRRRDLLISEASQTEFYLARLPEHINSVAALDKWWRLPVNKPATSRLFMSLNDLVTREPPAMLEELYPDRIAAGSNYLRVEYKFEPAATDDGVTIFLPEPLLSSIDADRLFWSVPGWQLEQITAILRALPKELRKHFVPVPEAAMRALQVLRDVPNPGAALAGWIAREAGVSYGAEQLSQLQIADHLKPFIRIIHLDGHTLASGRDLAQLRRELRSRPQSSMVLEATGLSKTWDFGTLLEQRVVDKAGVKFTVYPAVVSKDEGVQLIEVGSQEDAERLSRIGLRKLAMLALPQQLKYVRQQFAQHRELVLASQGLKTTRPLIDGFVERVFSECFFGGSVELPRSRAEFDDLLASRRGDVGAVTERLSKTVLDILTALRAVRIQLNSLTSTAFEALKADVEQQLAALLHEGFVISTPSPWFESLPRYLRGALRRIERTPINVKRDSELSAPIKVFMAAHQRLSKMAGAAAPAELTTLRWMIEEFRVSQFAQELKTSIPVSMKRIDEQIKRAEALLTK